MSAILQNTLQTYHYDLPKSAIAQTAVEPRDQSRLLVFSRRTGQWQDRHFFEIIDCLHAGDVLVLNQTRVFPARLFGRKASGGKVEILLLEQKENGTWLAISKPGLKVGQQILFPSAFVVEEALSFAEAAAMGCLVAEVIERAADSAEVVLRFNFSAAKFWQKVEEIGKTPLPPYIHSQEAENKLKERYQTVYAQNYGSAAAPTAGLHFTEALLEKLRDKGVQIEKVTLHVGLGTFAKLSEENLQKKTLHSEYYRIEAEVAERLNQAKKAGRRIIAVGTTTLRTLESAAALSQKAEVLPGARHTELFILPPYRFQMADALITNFHLPESSLLMLVSAFTSKPNTDFVFQDFSSSILGRAYQHAIEDGYRFFSFGDAMFISDELC